MPKAKSLIGNQAIQRYLQKVEKNGIVPHAQLWIGPAHIGKSTFLTNHLKQLKVDSQLGLRWIDATDCTMEVIKSVIADAAETSLFQGRRAIVIEQAELLNRNVWNAMLKLLEEPRSQITLFLLTSNHDMIPATVRSRCSQLWFTPVSTAELLSAWPDATEAIYWSHGLPGLVGYYQKRVSQLQAWKQLLQQDPLQRLAALPKLFPDKAKRTDALRAIDDIEAVLFTVLPASVTAFPILARTRQALRHPVQPKLALTNLLLNIHTI